MSRGDPFGIYENIKPWGRAEVSGYRYPSLSVGTRVSSSSGREPGGLPLRMTSNCHELDRVSDDTSSGTEKWSDSWFSKSFVNAGGFVGGGGGGGGSSSGVGRRYPPPPPDFETSPATPAATSPEGRVVMELSKGIEERSEELLSYPSAPPPPPPLKYRGSKTSPLVKPGDDWDFLTTLNDILRKENFLSESDSVVDSKSSRHGPSVGSSSSATAPPPHASSMGHNGYGPENSGAQSSLAQMPMSPRPPRPARKSDARRKEFMKARSMNLDGVLNVTSNSGDILPPSILFASEHQQQQHPNSSTISFGNPRQQHQQHQQQQQQQQQEHFRKQQVPHPGPPEPMGYGTGCIPNPPPPVSAGLSLVGKERSPSPAVSSALMPLPYGKQQQQQQQHCLSTTMSSSLDSIYDRLKSVEEYEKNNYLRGSGYVTPLLVGNYPPARLTDLGGGVGSSSSSSGRYNFVSSGRGSGRIPGGGSMSGMLTDPLCPPLPSYIGTSTLSCDNGLNHQHRHQQQQQQQQQQQFHNPAPLIPSWAPYTSYPADFEPLSGPRMSEKGDDLSDGPSQGYWMIPSFKSRSQGSLKGSLLGLDYEDRLLRLESDKDTLHLQVSVLSDQIEAQTSKIHDLERMLDDKKNVLENTEEQLQRELVTRSGLETQKLELMTEISGLRLKQATLERENLELKGRLTGTGRSLTDLNHPDSRMWEKPPLGPGVRGTSPAQTGADLGQRIRLTSDGGVSHSQQRVHTPPANAYRRVDQTASFGTLPRRNQPTLSTFNSAIGVSHPVDGGTKCNSLSSGNINAISVNFSQNGGNQNQSNISSSLHVDKSRQHQYQHPAGVSDVKSSSMLTPRTSLPQMMGPFVLEGVAVTSSPLQGNTGSLTGDRSTSVPNLAGDDDWQRRGNGSSGGSSVGKSPSGGGHKSRRILRILGKLKRSNSGGLENEVVPEAHSDLHSSSNNNPFVRGGHRATAAPRLGWVREQTPIKMPEGPVASWDSEAVVTWLNYLGLGIYANEVKRWVKSGQQLLDATAHEVEKELSIKNPLHRKKLSLALHYLKHPEEEDNAGKLDYHWVTRWLDDAGLPQYKEAFAEARVDGRILSHLTSEDLLSLKVVSVLHHASIKRGIQVLRIHHFHPSCLCRRSSSAGIGSDGSLRDPKHVATWTNHRVMEWLKAADLAEYAPNLRGSGVHGALMVFEPRFNAELLATLLSIPGNKTLLRRHLSLQFNDLVGRHIVQEKRLAEIAPDFVPINPTLKVKPMKKTPFPLRKKRLSNEFTEELLCPSDMNSYPSEWGSSNQPETTESTVPFGVGKVSNI